MEVDSRHFPNRLQIHRKQMRYTQKQAAAMLGIDPSLLSLWENGKQMPNGTNLLKLCLAYRALPTELYFEYYQELRDQFKAVVRGLITE